MMHASRRRRQHYGSSKMAGWNCEFVCKQLVQSARRLDWLVTDCILYIDDLDRQCCLKSATLR